MLIRLETNRAYTMNSRRSRRSHFTGGGTVANEYHVQILRKGAAEWNAWRRDHLTTRPTPASFLYPLR